MTTEVKKITLQIGKREIELSVDEARNLKAALEGLFGRDVVREVVRDGCHHWHWWQTPYSYTSMVTYDTTGVSNLPFNTSFNAESGDLSLSVT